MFATFLLCLVISTEPATAPQVRIAAPNLSVINLAPAMAPFLTEHLGQQLGLHGLTVITPKQIEAVLGLERQKQLLGCGDASASCIAEFASALGADGLVSGTIAKLGESYQINVSILSAAAGETLAVYQARANSEADVLDRLSDAAPKLANDLLVRLDRGPRAAPSRGWLWLGAGGLAAAATGAVFLGLSNSQHADLTRPDSPLRTLADAQAAAEAERRNQTIGLVGLGVGVAALAGAASLLVATPGDRGLQVAAITGPTTGLALRGEFP